MFQLNRYPNAVSVVFELFRYYNKNINRSFLVNEFEQHPDFPSLLSTSDVLTVLGFENHAVRINVDELSGLELPFIAHTRYSNGELVLVTGLDKNSVTISNGSWTRYKEKLPEFEKQYLGVAMLVEPPDEWKNTSKPSLAGLLSPWTGAAILVAVLVAGLLFNSSYLALLSWSTATLALFKTAGLIVSVLLLMQSIDANNPWVQKVCKTGEKVDCTAILSSKAAKVAGGLTWSEIGFFYFAGTWLLLLFGKGSPFILNVIAILNIISLPYTFYSIYHQAAVAKKWCVLCCIIQGVLWLEFVPGFTLLSSHAVFSPIGGDLSILFICLASPFSLWLILKPVFVKMQQAATYKEQLRDFKFNNDTFRTMLKEQPQYTLPDKEWSIVLGNAEAANTITMVTNPYCQPCSATHKLLDELLEQRTDLQARIVFSTSIISADEPKAAVGRHLMALNTLNDRSVVKKALSDWYEQKQKNYEGWAKSYPVDFNDDELRKMAKQKDWCYEVNVAFTPTVLLNGFVLPQQYKVSDLKYMLEAV